MDFGIEGYEMICKNEIFIERNPNSIFIQETEEKEIISIFNKCNNKTSTDCDGIHMKIIKWVIEGISKPLTYIFNLSFQTGIFPDKMKMAKVIPLFKTGNKHHINNYKPVSLLPHLSKILIFHHLLCILMIYAKGLKF